MIIPLERSIRRLDVAYETGSWCYWNDEPCPYQRDEEVSDWYAGFLAASRADQQAINEGALLV